MHAYSICLYIVVFICVLCTHWVYVYRCVCIYTNSNVQKRMCRCKGVRVRLVHMRVLKPWTWHWPPTTCVATPHVLHHHMCCNTTCVAHCRLALLICFNPSLVWLELSRRRKWQQGSPRSNIGYNTTEMGRGHGPWGHRKIPPIMGPRTLQE